ncbi:RNA polymerase sigma factor (sigma-70 family) [Cryobacterium sp. MP_3.1]|uniref:RNA polymerase sigma factor n=1 Tax=Cryobacterium sp. MP_3.1 TaxID=3071711 RepID=UPI002E08DBA4|nr:RNA polymerase sigma factor (sigma-70 family) [Cryobacterium sp. MP_3.1]
MSNTILTAEHAVELSVRIQAAGPFETAKQRSAREDRNTARTDGGREPASAIPPAAWELASFAEGSMKRIAANWAAANPQLVWDDLLQAAQLGAVAAALTFAPEKGAFVSYAKHDIAGAIREYASEMHEHASVPPDMVASNQRGSEATKAAAASWSKSISLDNDSADSETAPLRDRIGAPEAGLSVEEKLSVQAAVKSLSVRAQQVLALVIDADLTSGEAAKILQVSEQAVRANRQRALSALEPILKEIFA